MDNPLSAEQAADLFIAILHGLTALHLANELHIPVGVGGFGALIPAALTFVYKAWSKH